MPLPIFKPETNIPYEVAMRYDEPRIVSSKLNANEQQAMITLVSGQVVYAPKFVAARLAQLGIRKEQKFQLIRKEVHENGSRGIRWEISPLNTAKPEPRTPAPPVEAPQTASNSLQSQPLQVNSTAPGVTAAGKLMSAFMASIDAIAEAQTYANRKQLGITFTSEDIRSVAISVYISACREGR